ncbi:MAG: hypothetical protein KF803_14515 [Cyclobacteriaceae bacterium]|nr:hypothetical protein [Cyclobacteriaceae bacterium]
MEHLSKDWLTQGLVDFEYKKYVLLAYLKKVKRSFERVELYPHMADLVFHYRNLLAIRDNKTLLRESFPKELSLEEFHKLELSYRKMIEDDAVMSELESIIEFSIPQVKDSLQEGSVIFEYVESQCEISPIGVTPLYAKEGYLFVTQPPEHETISKTPMVTYESLKLDLLRKYKDFPNPATYLILSRMKFPFSETLMPVAKRLFVKHLAHAA